LIEEKSQYKLEIQPQTYKLASLDQRKHRVPATKATFDFQRGLFFANQSWWNSSKLPESRIQNLIEQAELN
tara:strand:- start:1566 stop:1778 length:213 start_codon:yes stop_codon:yes gene_type:complete